MLKQIDKALYFITKSFNIQSNNNKSGIKHTAVDNSYNQAVDLINWWKELKNK